MLGSVEDAHPIIGFFGGMGKNKWVNPKFSKG
jgi:hypothetical protein